MLYTHGDFCWIPRKVPVFCRVHEDAAESFPLFYSGEERLHEYLSVPVLYWSDALYNCVLGKALAESTWNYHIVRIGANPGGMISAGTLDCH